MPPVILRRLLVAGAAASLQALAPQAMAQDATAQEASRVTLSVGESHWRGNFGAVDRTDINALLASIRYSVGGLRLSASLPWMKIESTGAVFTGVDGTPLIVAPNSLNNRAVREGLADLTLTGSYLFADVAGLDLDFTGKVKLPTGSTRRGVSTGKTDYSVSAEASRTLGRFTPSVRVGYRVFGDNATWKLKDGFAGSAAGSYIFGDRTTAFLSYDFAQAASRFAKDSHEVSFGLSRPFARDRVRLSAYIAHGMSKGAADLSGGLSLALNL